MLATIEFKMHPCRFWGSKNGEYYCNYRTNDDVDYKTNFVKKGKYMYMVKSGRLHLVK